MERDGRPERAYGDARVGTDVAQHGVVIAALCCEPFARDAETWVPVRDDLVLINGGVGGDDRALDIARQLGVACFR